MTKEIIFITGGAKSGKSRKALEYADKYSIKYFLATAEARDEEMEKKIQLHQDERGKEWINIEEPIEIWKTIENIEGENGVILVDCITLWLTNLMMQFPKEDIPDFVGKFTAAIEKTPLSVIIVTNEVGLGIVPIPKMGRDFIELAGRANQTIADISDTALFVVSGQPLILKGHL